MALPICRFGYCVNDAVTLSADNEMDICHPSSHGLDILTEIESMLVALYRPIAQIWAIRTGQTAYLGHSANLEQRA